MTSCLFMPTNVVRICTIQAIRVKTCYYSAYKLALRRTFSTCLFLFPILLDVYNILFWMCGLDFIFCFYFFNKCRFCFLLVECLFGISMKLNGNNVLVYVWEKTSIIVYRRRMFVLMFMLCFIHFEHNSIKVQLRLPREQYDCLKIYLIRALSWIENIFSDKK